MVYEVEMQQRSIGFINGFDVATDLKTGLKGVWVLLAAHVVYGIPCMRWPVVFTHSARLQDDTQLWDLLLAKGDEHKGLSGVGRSSSDGEREAHS